MSAGARPTGLPWIDSPVAWRARVLLAAEGLMAKEHPGRTHWGRYTLSEQQDYLLRADGILRESYR